MNRDVVFGVDTSNYTTSIAIVEADTGTLLGEARRLLPVAPGERGLRQSEAFYHHVQQLPGLFAQAIQPLAADSLVWRAIGVSVRPRPLCNSYMPVFTAGLRMAELLGTAHRAPVVHTSHQEGHLEAAIRSVETDPGHRFFAVHLSGGTSDVLLAERTRFGYRIDMIGEGADLHAGQFVDRIGVQLGLPFPAGPALERLAAEVAEPPDLRFPVRVVDCRLSFSGPCSAAERAIVKGAHPAAVAFAVQAAVANGVTKAVTDAAKRHSEVRHCVLAGGVMSNAWIKARILHRLSILCPELRVHVAHPRYASDNAYGVASLATRFCHSL